MFRRLLVGLLGGRGKPQRPAASPQPDGRAGALMTGIDATLHRVSASTSARDAAFDAARAAFLAEASAHVDAAGMRLVQAARYGDRYAWMLHQRVTHVKSLAADDLGPMFASLMALRDAMGWGKMIPERFPVVGQRFSPSEPRQIVLMSAEATLAARCEVGFKPGPAQAEPILRFLLTTPCLDIPHDMISDFLSLNILRRLNQVCKTHADLPENARPPATALAQRALTTATQGRPAALADTALPLAKARALMALAGLRRDGLLQRMRRLPPPRLESADFQGRYASVLPVLARIAARTDALIAEFTAAGGKPAWLMDEEAYADRFNTAGDADAAFGWWLRPRPATTGANGFHAHAYAAMCRADAFAQRQDWLRQLQALLAADEGHLPWTFATDRLPDPEAFTFGGADPEGQLLEHLATATAAKPAQAWLKTAAGHVARIGAARVEEGFARWLGHAAVPVDESRLDPLPADRLLRMAEILRSQLDRLAPAKAGPATDLPERDLNLLALTAMRSDAIFASAMPRQDRTGWSGSQLQRLHRSPLSDINVAVMTGVLWAFSLLGPQASLAPIVGAATFCFAKHHGAFRSRKAGNAALWTLGQIGTRGAVHALARIRRGVVRDKAISTEVDKALAVTGHKAGLDLEDMLELSVEDWGIGPGGLRRERLGDWAVTLRVTSTRATVIESRPWGNPDAAARRGIPKDALATPDAQDLAQELQAAATDIPKLLREVRARLDVAIRRQRSWTWPDWQERFAENALVATVAHRVIWSLHWPDDARAELLYQDGGFRDVAGRPLERPVADARLAVWHPLLAGGTDAVDWADRLAALGVRQPFPQAWRPIYQLTPPELETRNYSNRFARHILHQPAFVAVLRQRGWVAFSQQAFPRDAPEASNRVDLPAFGISARVWAAGLGASGPSGHDYGGAAFDNVTTDRVVFFKTGTQDPLDLDQIPAIAFSEVLRDVELAIGIASIGRDQFWTDRGTDAAHPANRLGGAEAYRQAFAARGSAELVAMRHQALARLLPGLEIGAHTRPLTSAVEVTGTSGRSYAIHLGSAAVHMLPGRRHLCIVPGRAGLFDEGPVPFEGDAIFAEILSKLVLLAADSLIDVPQIRRQMGL